MTSAQIELYGAALGVILSVCVLLGIGYKYVLLPNLEKNLYKPVAETHKQLTVNHHSSDPATLRDMIDNVRGDLERSRARMLDAVNGVRNDVGEVREEVRVIRHTQDRQGTEIKDHLEWSEEHRKANSEEQIAMWEAIGKIAAAPATPIETVLGSKESK